ACWGGWAFQPAATKFSSWGGPPAYILVMISATAGLGPAFMTMSWLRDWKTACWLLLSNGAGPKVRKWMSNGMNWAASLVALRLLNGGAPAVTAPPGFSPPWQTMHNWGIGRAPSRSRLAELSSLLPSLL